MNMKLLYVMLATLAISGCASLENAIGQITVKNYTAETGERVMAGQAEPKDEYHCRLISQQTQDWGLSGNMNKAAAIERVTAVAVDTAPGLGANYAFVRIPSETSILGFNINAFDDAQVAYYACNNLPPAG